MASFSWYRWVQSLLRPRTQTYRKKRGNRPRLHQLEDRVTPSTFVWTGLGSSANWSSAGNWANNVAPTGQNSQLDDLVFPSNVTQKTSINNLTGAQINSITFSADGYTLQGNPITLGSSSPNSGSITENAGQFNDTIGLNIVVGVASGSKQFITVNSGATLTISGALSGSTSPQVTKEGVGTLVLTADNSLFTGQITVDNSGGVLAISNGHALGSSAAPVVVDTNSQLQLLTGTGTVSNSLILSGPGVTNTGALLNVAGKNVWAGNIQMDSDTIFGAGTGSQLTITSQISDTGTGHNLTKEGLGKIIFASANSYRGQTIINNGVLDIQNPQALGTADGTAQTGTFVNSSVTETGTLQIEDPKGIGFTVANEQLTLNGYGGFNAGIGALDNFNGNNTWTGNIILGSLAPNESVVTIRTEESTSLLVSGIVEDPNGLPPGTYELTKTGNGTLIFVSHNTYRGKTDIQAGILNIRDSNALGDPAHAGTTVENGATLELSVDSIPDSVTGTTNTLVVPDPLQITGTGFENLGALRSASGINIYAGTITIPYTGSSLTPTTYSAIASIGVDADPNPTSGPNYFPTYSPVTGYPLTGDYSLTVTGAVSGAYPSELEKDGQGQLILPKANPGLTSSIHIRQGWITVENNESLGNIVPTYPQTLQPTVYIDNGAAVHLDDVKGTHLSLAENFSLTGEGMSHPYGLINDTGAIENINGTNTITGNIFLIQQVGIGVETVPAPLTTTGRPSLLTLTGQIADTRPVLSLASASQGGPAEDDDIIQTGSTSGTITVNYNMYTLPDSLDIYHGINGQGGTRIYTSGGPISGSGTVTVPYGPPSDSNSSTFVEIVINLGGSSEPGTVWDYTATVAPTVTQGGGIDKLGTQRLIIQGPGTYTGPVNIKAGVLRDQNDTGLGAVGGGAVTVSSGTALEFADTVADLNGGIQRGIQVWGKSLILNSSGNNGLDSVSLQPYNDATVTNLSGDDMWRGTTTLATSAIIDVDTGTRLTLFGAIDDQPDPNPSDLTINPNLYPNVLGELDLAGSNTYRGNTYIDQGIVTIENSQAFGAPTTYNPDGSIADGQVTVTDNAQLQIEGNLTISGKALTVQGTGMGSIPTNLPVGWFSTGPAPINPGTEPGKQALSGQVNSIAADPKDPNIIYLTAADGGLWKTINNGLTWQPLTDNVISSLGTTLDDAAGNPIPLFMDSVAVNPVNSNIIYAGTGELTFLSDSFNYAAGTPITTADSYYGVGVLESTDAGMHWSLVPGSSQFYGDVISQVVPDPTDSSGGTIYLAVSTGPVAGIYTPGKEGIWKYDAGVWTDLTALISPNRLSQTPPLAVAGPDDDLNAQFFTSVTSTFDHAAYYTDLQVIPDPNYYPNNNPFVTGYPNDPAEPGHWANQFIVFAEDDPLGGTETFNLTTGYYSNSMYLSLDDGGLNTAMLATYDAAAINVGENWFETGFPTTDEHTDIFGGAHYYPHNGVITSAPAPTPMPFNTAVPADDTQVIYAANIYPGDGYDTALNPLYPLFNLTPGADDFLEYSLRDVLRISLNWSNTTDLYTQAGWGNTGTQPATPVSTTQPISSAYGGYTGWSPTYPVSFGDFNLALGVDPANGDVYLGGVDEPYTQGVFESTNGGGAWANVGIDAAGNAPFENAHAITFDSNGRLLIGTDGGIWALPTGTTPKWVDLNSNLAITQDNSVAVDPNIIGSALEGTQATGLAQFANTPTQANLLAGDVGQVYIDPQNTNIVYADDNGFLKESTNGGTSWSTVLTVGDLPATTYAYPAVPGRPDYPLADLNSPVPAGEQVYFPFVLDNVNPSRLVVGTGGDPAWLIDPAGNYVLQDAIPSLEESVNGGTSWLPIPVPAYPNGTPLAGLNFQITALGLAEYQGAFLADASFPLVGDKGANTYDPDTVYITDGASLYLTKNLHEAVTWANRTPAGLTGTIEQIVVDPRNEDTVYIVVGGFGTQHVYMSSDAGLHWMNISTGLPNVPAWNLALDPRNNNLYLGTDQGVYVLTGGVGVWQPFGTGLANVQVVGLTLNQALNTLTAATSGRGTYQMFLDVQQANSGGLRAVSGSVIWAGPIFLSGPTTIEADGTQVIQNGVSQAQLNVIGTIADLNPATGSTDTLTKIGFGNVIFSGANTYGGTTYVQQGVLIVNNPQALGDPTSPTIVESGTSLELQTDLDLEPVELNGDGISFNGHYLGALRNVSSDNTYTGNVTLETPSTIGVDSGSFLTITGNIGDNGNNFNLTKESTGTLALAGNDTYGGITYVNQGVLQLQSSQALGAGGSATNGTVVLDGAQIQLQTPTTGPLAGLPVVINNEFLSLTGTGIYGTGAMLDTAGSNTWNGPITLDDNPAFLPLSSPGGVISFGVANPGDLLTIGGLISDPLQPTGVMKVGPGTLVLTSNGNSYRGTTYIDQGSVRVEAANALGNSAAPEIQRLTLSAPTNFTTGTFSLAFNDLNPSLHNTGNLAFGITAANLAAALNALATIGGVGGSVSVSENTSIVSGYKVEVFTITFGGALAGQNLPLLTIPNISAAINGAISNVADGTIGTLVTAGTSLQVEGDPNNVGASIAVPEPIALNGYGVDPADSGGLENVNGNDTWTGSVTLESATSIGVDPGTQFTVTGKVEDPVPVPVPAASLSKVGLGKLVFPNANTYTGLTYVNQGVLNIQNPGALGGVVNETETVELTGPRTGTFTLTFDNQTTGSLSGGATAADVQTALDGLSSIGGAGGSVNVTLNGSIFTVVFQGSLANLNVPEMTGLGSGGTGVIITTVNDGSEGTVVNSGASLQLQGGIKVSTEALTVNGAGFNGNGALENAGGNNTWNNPITLGSGSSIGVDNPGDTLHITQAIGDQGNNYGVTKVGPGYLDYDVANTYTGLTQVNDGTLLLDDPTGHAIAGNLTIGDGPAIARWLFSNELSALATVLVNGDGVLDLNGKTQTLGLLEVVDGLVQTGTAGDGQLTVDALEMTGGTVQTSTAGGQLILNGNVTATSDATGPAEINGVGQLSLGGATRTFDANAGVGPVDMEVNAVISGTASEGLTMTGSGVLELDATNTYSGPTTIDSGDVQVDGSIGQVDLNGGTLSGTGNVGNVNGTAPASAATGTVDPGDNGSSAPYGILNSQAETWGSQATYWVDLNKAASGAGTGYDQLDVNGNISLGGAMLTGSVTPNVGIGDSFTIIQTTSGTVQGRFAEPYGEEPGTTEGIMFFGGDKFLVNYTSHSVVLTRVKADVVLTPSSSVNPSVYGQDVSFTITVSPELGATLPFNANDTVTFTLDGDAATAQTVLLNSSDQATVDYSLLTPAGQFLTVGQHSLVLSFSGDANYNPGSDSASPFEQTVNQASTSLTVSSSPTSPVYGQDVTVTATVTAVSPGAGTPNAGTVTFTVDGQVQPVVNLGSGGQATIDLSSLDLTATTHQIAVSYSGDTSYLPVATTQNYLLTIGQDGSSIVFTPVPNEPVYGQSTTLSATVTAALPGSGTPTGNVTFWDGPVGSGINLGTSQINGVAQVTVPSFSAGSHSINISYSGDTNFVPVQAGFSLNVNQAQTQTMLMTSASPAVVGTVVKFTATISNVSSLNSNGTPIPLGSVAFVIDGSTKATVGLNSMGVANFYSLIAGVGNHTVTANYLGTSNFATSTQSLIQSILSQSVTTLSVAPSSSVYGQSVTFTAVVKPGSSTTSTPSGSVTLNVNGQNLLPASVLNALGQATFTLNNNYLSVGTNAIYVSYSGDSGFISSQSSTLNYKVSPISTTMTLGASSSSTVFGQPVTFTATLKPVAPGTLTPAGQVTFLVDGVAQSPAVNLDVSGQATFTTSTLSAGTHTITASYSGGTNFVSNSKKLSYAVKQISTTIQFESPTTSAVYGEPVTYTVQVQPVAPGTGVPTGGQVIFVEDGAIMATKTLDSTGQASATWNSTGAVGTHAIAAKFLGTTDYAISVVSGVHLAVTHAATSVSVSTPQSPAVVGEPVIFTATVTPQAPTTAPVTSGTVTFYVDGVAVTTVTVNSLGKAQYVTAALTAKTHQIAAKYNGNVNFLSQLSPQFTEVVTAPGTTPTKTLLQSSANPSNAGQSVTFTTTITSASGTPTGWVLFVVDGKNISFVQLDGTGQATYQTSFATAGSSHKVSVIYYGDPTFAPSNDSATPLIQRVNSSTGGSGGGGGTTSTQVVGLTASLMANSDGTFTVTADAVNSNGNTVSSYDQPATLTVLSAPSGGSLSGPTSAKFSNGIATFAELTPSQPGTYIVEISSGGFTVDVTINGGRLT